MEGHEEVFFDAHSSFSPVESAEQPGPEAVNAQLHALQTLLPDLMTSIASLRDSAVQYVKTSVKQAADGSMGSTANIEAKRRIAQEHGCHLSHPFNQNKFLFEKTIDDRPFAADYSRAGGEGHACFGLAVNWCQSRAKNQPDELFFEKLANYRDDALLPRVLAFQHVEQQAYPGKIENAKPMLLGTLPKLGMTLDKGRGTAQHGHYGIKLADLGRDLKTLSQPVKARTFLLLSESHAMALHQDSQGGMHFFDPLFGVVQADNCEKMSSFLADVFKRDTRSHWKGADHRLQISEVVPGADFRFR